MVEIGSVRLGAPVMLAPMAGVTNPPFRALCREAGEAGLRDLGYGAQIDAAWQEGVRGTYAPAGLYVCEMITTRALVERKWQTMAMIAPDEGDPVRAIQLYGVQPHTTAEAVRILVEEDRADYVDLNFGCPVPKVTRKGGGSALPWKIDLFEEIVTAAVRSAERASRVGGRSHVVPVTMKIRIGIDDDHQTALDALKIAENAGIAAVTLHARTTAQHYSGQAQWDHIARLVEATHLPVFGNGDVFEADDAVAMREQTGCAGVVIGRGCQGRPWIFRDMTTRLLEPADGVELPPLSAPTLGEVGQLMRRHTVAAIEFFGNEYHAIREMRKHFGWYLRGYAVGGGGRQAFATVESLEHLDRLLADLEVDQPYPEAATGARGRAGRVKRPHLPEGWLDSRYLSPSQRATIDQAEIDVDGG